MSGTTELEMTNWILVELKNVELEDDRLGNDIRKSD